MTRRTAPLTVLGGVLMLAGVLTACATPVGGSGGGTAEPRGGDTSSATPSESVMGELDAAWLDGGRIIGLVTSGSSTCVPAATDAVVDGGVLTVAVAEPDRPCTRDYVPRVTLVNAPEGVDPSRDLDIAVTGSAVGRTRLAAVEGLTGGGDTDYLPSAGWTGASGELVLVTWGSSGCPPVVQDAAATGPAEITVTFVTPPADQVCTADMAPRGTVVTVSGLESEAGAEVVLAGAGFENVRVPILGSPSPPL